MTLLHQFIISFFVSKRVSLITAFLCWRPEVVHEWLRSSSDAGLRVRVVSDWPASPLPPDGTPREGVLLDLACEDAHLVLQQASSSRAFNLRYTWLLLHEDAYNESFVHESLSAAAILPDADVTLAAPDALTDVYRIKADRPLIVTPWELNNTASLSIFEEFWPKQATTVTRRKDLQNVRLEAVVIVSQPQYFHGWSDVMRDRQIDTHPKATYPIMMQLAEDLNYRYNMRQTTLYGEVHNGSFDGLAGALQRRRAELGATSLFMRPDRWQVMHFAAETLEISSAFIFRQPAQAAVRNVFVLPFSRGVWAGAAGTCAGAALLLAALARRLGRADPALARISYAETFTFAIGTICQQGFHVTPRATSARLVMFSMLMMALFAFTSYSAKVVVILQAPSDALRSINDLAHSSIAVGVQETTYKKVYFAESSDPATQRLYRKKLLPFGERAYMSVVDGIARVRTQFFAFQVEESSGYDIISKTFTEREKCGLKQIQAFKMPMVAVPLQKHSGYRDLVAARVRWQREVGLMQRVRRTWMSEKPRCDAGAGGFTSVAVQDVLPCIKMLVMGCVVSVVLLCGECALHRGRRGRGARGNPTENTRPTHRS